MPDRGASLLVSLAVSTLLCGSAVAGDPPQSDPVTDAELLEFLGSVDSGADSQPTADDGSWIDYLAQTDIGKVAKKADPDTLRKGATGDPPPESGDKK